MATICFGILVMYCSPMQQPATAGATFCEMYEPVYWHAKDTRRSKEKNDRNNRKYERICGGKK